MFLTRKLRVALVAALACTVAVLPSAGEALAAAKPSTRLYACMKRSSGKVRFTSKLTRCKRGEKISFKAPSGKNGSGGLQGLKA